MSQTVSQFWNNHLGTTPLIQHGMYRFTDLHLVPQLPGIYSWHLMVDRGNYPEYYKVFKQRKFKVTAKAALDDLYEGNLIHSKVDSNYSATIDMGLCSISSLAFCPPLYIGISKDLESRLDEHSKELHKAMSVLPAPIPTLLKSEFDTIYESTFFAHRIGFIIRKNTSITLSDLVIKTVEMPSTFTWGELQKVEKFLNRSFAPIYGRK